MKKNDLAQYVDNPFTRELIDKNNTKWKTRAIARNGDKVLVDNVTGEVEGVRGIIIKEQVDREKFVKLYIDGIAAILNLKSAGKKIFLLICEELSKPKNIGRMDIVLNYSLYQETCEKQPMGETTFHRGVNECLKANILARSYSNCFYFVNPNFIFNGNRMAVIKLYEVNKSPTEAEVIEAASEK